MTKINVILISFALIFFAVVSANAQDNMQGKNKKTGSDCSVEKSGCCSEEEKAAVSVLPFNEVCPVLGNKINSKVKTVEYNGKVYGFCCPGCDDKFSKEPEKYIKNLSSDGKKFIKGKA